MSESTVDVLLIGSGIMSTSLGMFLKKLDPSLSITLMEQQEDIATESTHGWNNAGTGHAAYCELNYTPLKDDNTISIDKARDINESFEISLQFWSYLVEQGILPNPETFIHRTPHMSFVWGDSDVDFLHKRYQALKTLSQFKEMQYSQDPEIISSWIPLIMRGRDPAQPVAATRVDHGVDVDFGTISRHMLDYLVKQKNFNVHTHNRVIDLYQSDDKRWRVLVNNRKTKDIYTIKSKFVFIGAGGAAIHLLQKSRINISQDYGGFPVSGQFLVCKNPSIVTEHHAKVYGKAKIGAPPMSVPHLDTRIIDGHKVLLFGPFAGFTTKFLKSGSWLDWVKSVRPHNLWAMLQVGVKNLSLIWYLIKEGTQNHKARMSALREYFPKAKDEDWELLHAGQRVQIIKQTENGGVLQFGTEVVSAHDHTLAALLGASPGASVVAEIVLDILEKNFAEQLQSQSWQSAIKELVPSYQQSLQNDADLLEKIRQRVVKVLKLTE